MAWKPSSKCPMLFNTEKNVFLTSCSQHLQQLKVFDANPLNVARQIGWSQSRNKNQIIKQMWLQWHNNKGGEKNITIQDEGCNDSSITSMYRFILLWSNYIDRYSVSCPLRGMSIDLKSIYKENNFINAKNLHLVLKDDKCYMDVFLALSQGQWRGTARRVRDFQARVWGSVCGNFLTFAKWEIWLIKHSLLAEYERPDKR